jgi:hypothetical protein
MRRLALASCVLAALSLGSCSSEAPRADEPLGTAESPIAYGNADTAHTAVVALLAPISGGFTECSGTIVQNKNGAGYVLTAAHCCNNGAPTLVVMSNDYTVGEQYLGGSTPQPPVYAVTAGSVWWDDKFAGAGTPYDFCMLKFAAPANASVIPVATGTDGLSLGVTAEHVGFGATDTNSSNSGRRTGSAPVDVSLTATTFTSDQGGTSHIQGTCEGDSGGPALLPAGAAQSAQTVVGTTSTGNASACSSITQNTDMRVTSETGAGGFITSFLADTPIGQQVGGTETCSTCATSAQSGACKTEASACANDPACITLDDCLGACSTSSCKQGCQTTAGTTAVNELDAFEACICDTACATPCASSCGSGSSCGLSTQVAACNTCIQASCCAEGVACAEDASCLTCIGTNPECTTNANANAFNQCLSSNCASACGSSSSSSSTSTSSSGASTAASTSSASGATSSSGGEGAGGAQSSGTAAGGSANTASTGNASTGNGSLGAGGVGSASTGSLGTGAGSGSTPGGKGSCAVGSVEPSPKGSLASVLFGAALVLAGRRRRARSIEPVASSIEPVASPFPPRANLWRALRSEAR